MNCPVLYAWYVAACPSLCQLVSQEMDAVCGDWVEHQGCVQLCLGGVSEKMQIPHLEISKTAIIHLQLNKELWLAETVSEMATPTASRYFQRTALTDWNWQPLYCGGSIGGFCILTQKPQNQLRHPERKLAKEHCGTIAGLWSVPWTRPCSSM